MWRRRFLHQEITETVGAVDNDCMLPVWNHHLLSLAWYKWAYRTRQGINLLLLAIAQKGHFHTESDRFYYDRRGSCSFLLLSFLSAHIFDSTCSYSKYIWCNFFFVAWYIHSILIIIALSVLVCLFWFKFFFRSLWNGQNIQLTLSIPQRDTTHFIELKKKLTTYAYININKNYYIHHIKKYKKSLHMIT